MNLFDFRVRESSIFEAIIDMPDIAIQIKKPVKLWVEGELIYLAQGNHIAVINHMESKDQSFNQAVMHIAQNNILWTLLKKVEDKIWLLPMELDGETITVDTLSIGVNEYIVEQLTKQKLIKDAEYGLALEWLTEQFFINQDMSLLGINQNEVMAFSIVHFNQDSDGLSLVNQDYVIDIQVTDNYWSLERMRPFNQGNKEVQLLAIRGKLSFVDASQAVQMNNPVIKAALVDSKKGHGDYIETWRRYSDMQWQLEILEASKLDYLYFKNAESAPNQNEWYVDVESNQLNAFKSALQNFANNSKTNPSYEFQVDTKLPDWLKSNQVSKPSNKTDKQDISTPWRAKVVNIDIEKGRLTLEFTGKREQRIPNDKGKGYLFLSIYSTLVQRERQVFALEQVSSRKNPMPSLDYLIQGIAVPIKKANRLKWSSTKVRSLFKNSLPTTKQKQAIELSLNSTDVSVIIGPPGTGKTQVIAAIQQRIVEEKKDAPVQRSVLLTSYQHDAVDNVNARTQVLGLPGLRVGGKYQDMVGTKDINSPISRWQASTASNLKHELDGCQALIALKELESATLRLRLGNTKMKEQSMAQISNILQSLDTHYRITPTYDWQIWWQDFVIKKSYFETSKLQHYNANIWALRTSEISFADDGIQQCIKLRALLQLLQNEYPDSKIISDDELAILDKYSHSNCISADYTDFSSLQILKNKLLDRSLPDFRPRNLQSILDADTCKKLDQLVLHITNEISKQHSLGYLMVLDRFYKVLTTDDNEIEETIAHYTSVYAATCQQAASQSMHRLAEVDNHNSIVFENVIVDEAARATPLDLMIPMAMASKRLVLVGDHRQLPHMIDEAVETQLSLDENFETLQQEMLRDSLFQRMVINLQRLEKENGQPKRVVMLDTQFRMHPQLGDFISKNFYESHGLPKLKSGRPKEDFLHGITGYKNKICHWQDIRNNHTGSKRRNVNEASWIAKETVRILIEKPELSIGVISFYRDQVNTILDEMQRLDVVQDKKVVTEFQQLAAGPNIGDERLRVGTVDAFQGKEFDVVFLSLVRTLPQNLTTVSLDNTQHEKLLNSTYGFLRVDNRLNVAFSRQRSLIIMVGDLSLAEHPLTVKNIPSLSALAQLCRGEYGQIL